MKRYVGKKSVLAEPMKKGVAYYNNLLKKGVAPKHDEVDNPGYHIVYEDGYESWSPASVFERSYNLAETYQDRMGIEYRELYQRAKKAYQAVTDNKNTLDPYSLFLLKMQVNYMVEYHRILSQRIVKANKEEDTSLFRMDFGGAVKALKDGYVVRRKSWEVGKMIVKQQFCMVNDSIIPNMKSLPESAKKIILQSTGFLEYRNQILVIFPDGRADSYIPSTEDIFATDWVVSLPNE